MNTKTYNWCYEATPEFVDSDSFLVPLPELIFISQRDSQQRVAVGENIEAATQISGGRQCGHFVAEQETPVPLESIIAGDAART